MDAPRDLLQSIGGTAPVRLGRVVPADCAEILVKLESQNPTGPTTHCSASCR